MEKSYINEIRRIMAEASMNGQDIKSVFQELQQTPWDEWTTEIKQLEYPMCICCVCFHNTTYDVMRLSASGMICENCQQKQRIEYSTTPIHCQTCNQSHLPDEIIMVTIPTKTVRHTRTIKACPDRTDLVLDQYKITCMVCDKRYLPFNSQRLCDDCCHSPNNLEADRVYNQNKRALDLDLPATLTLKQWLATLKFFNGKCAYCFRNFRGMEHYIPLGMNGAGTTATNCVPSCGSCNNRKSAKHPDDFAALFPSENITRIKAYFASLATSPTP